MAYSKAKLKSSGDRASPCFRPFWIRKLSDKCLPVQNLPYCPFKHFNHPVSLASLYTTGYEVVKLNVEYLLARLALSNCICYCEEK
jgi:hypothetical protein